MPTLMSAAKRQPITLAQLSSYDDILTDVLVDHVSCIQHIFIAAFRLVN